MIFKISYKIFIHICRQISWGWDKFATLVRFAGNGVRHGSFRTKGKPYVMVAMDASMKIGPGFRMNNGPKSSPIGCPQNCVFYVSKGSSIEIGSDVGISQAALIAFAPIKIGNNVKIGGGTCIWTTDFHSLDAAERRKEGDHGACAPVTVGDDAFIGGRCIILKGVTIGKSSVVGAGSVVTHDIPDNEVWAGNPARKIRGN